PDMAESNPPDLAEQERGGRDAAGTYFSLLARQILPHHRGFPVTPAGNPPATAPAVSVWGIEGAGIPCPTHAGCAENPPGSRCRGSGGTAPSRRRSACC